MQICKLLAACSLACASIAGPATAAPDTRPAPRAGAKLPTSTVKIFASGAWTRDETDADGNALPQTSGCLAKPELKQVAGSLHSAPWKVTTARIKCMAVSPQFTEYHIDGKLVFTQRLCSGQSLDARSQAALDAATKRVEPAATKSP
ncbi:MAG: hypothetical protein E6J91_21725 [Deltaproteobacteria bacterium]|nr:MAG: hypothetical protein E6J91_21725 [Deltaproteobacteria bacterium]